MDQIKVEDVDLGDKGYSTEASIIGFKPGYWPLQVQLGDNLYIRKHGLYHAGDLGAMVYAPATGRGILLTILND